MYELADLMLRLCSLLRSATWSDPGAEYELGCIAERLEKIVGDMGNDIQRRS